MNRQSWLLNLSLLKTHPAFRAVFIARFISILSLGLLGVAAADVKTLYLAGGFGLHLSLEHAIGCGLLPGFTPAQIQVVGNTSLGGAFLALNDRSFLAEMQSTCARLESIELNLQPGFEDAYIDELMLPVPDS